MSLRRRAESGPNRRGNPVQFGAFRVVSVARRQLQPEPVSAEARDEMQMDVWYFLAGLLAVGKEEVHGFALRPARFRRRAQRRSQTPRCREHTGAVGRLQFGEIGRVAKRNDEQVPRRYRRCVQERDDAVIPEQ
jgi:hypothetical protein